MNVSSCASLDALCPSQPVGFFTWSVPDNLLFGDEVFADLYELPAQELAEGIAVETILFRIVEEDRAEMAKRIHASILSGDFSSSRYRILCPSGARKTLISNGRCFHDAEGVPSYYPGTVMLAPEETNASHGSALEGYIKAAIVEARKEGRDLTARYLSSALGSLALGGRSE